MKKILVVSPVASHPQFSGNTTRISEICHFIQSQNVELHFCYFSTPVFESHWVEHVMRKHWGERLHKLPSTKTRLSQIKSRCLRFAKRIANKFPPNVISNYVADFHFDDHVAGRKDAANFHVLVDMINPETILVEYVALSKLIAGLPRNICKVVDTHDVFFDRNKRIRREGGRSNWISFRQTQEFKMLKRFDHVLAIQKSEYDYFKKILVDTKIEVSLVDVLEGSVDLPARRKREMKIGYIGAKSRLNFDGLKVFLDTHWNNIYEQLPDIRLLIAGATYTELEKYSEKGVQMLGRVESLKDFYASVDAIINPTFAGSGLKMKSVEALRYSKVLITTPEGAAGLEEGIASKCIYSAQLRDDEFAKNVILALTQSSANLIESQNKAKEFVNEKCMRSAFELKSSLSI